MKPVSAQGLTRFAGPTNSQTLALSADDTLLAVVNPDNDSVSFFDVRTGIDAKIGEVSVGKEPNSVALSPDGTRAYVANTVSGTVTILILDRNANSYSSVLATVPVGTEPYALALTPTGRKLYVANARSNSVSVIDTASYQVIRTIADVGFEPRGIAITNSGIGEDSAETVYVTQFLAVPNGNKIDGSDDAKVGRVTVISAASDTVVGQVTLNPLADTGFKAAGDALARVAPPAAPVADDFKFVTGAYPNQLNNIAIRGKYAFVPSTGASPNGPVRFNVNTQSLLSAIDLTTRTDAGKTINMHSAVGKQTATPKRFITQPWAMAFKRQVDEGYVISAASNILVKVKVDGTGAATVQNDPADSTRVLQIATGKNPRGVVVASNDKTAFVMNYVSRDVTVVDLSGAVEKVTTTMKSANLPAAGTQEDAVQVGKELYHTSVGEFDSPGEGKPGITGRMSDNGWGSCGSCHPFGHSDNVVWIFPPGPRRTISQHVDFNQTDTNRTIMKALNWSAEREEQEDFELNIRGVSGGAGLIVQADGVTPDTSVANFTPLANGGRNQLKVRGVGAWDGIKAYVARGIRAPISPISKTDPDVIAGRQLFTRANCQNCHGGAQWTTSRVRQAAPPDASLISAGQLITELRPLNTFDPAAFNEVRATAVAPLGAAGFNAPSLLSLHAFPQTFFHNGSVNSLDALMQNVAHRSAGTGADTLASAAQRAQLTKFLLSIDAATVPIDPSAPTAFKTVISASFGGNAVAPESIAAGFGEKLASRVLSASSAALAQTLDGATLSIKDAVGVLRLARLFFVSPGQINFEVPAAAAEGNATLTVISGSGATASGAVNIRNVSPGVFSANGNGAGVAAAQAVRIAADGTQTPVNLFQCDAAGKCVPAAVDLGPETDQLYVSLYGTGIRKRTSLDNVRATIGGVDAPVSFAGAQGSVGLDQVNLRVPASLKGKGEVPVLLTVDGQTSNPVTLMLQ